MLQWFILISGLLAMILGADRLVHGCVRLSRRIGVSEFLTSVLIIGIGTSLPELIISVISSMRGVGTLAISNTIGSNIINILGILGVGMLLHPIATGGKKHRRDVAFTWLSACALMFAVSDGVVGIYDGIMFLMIFAAYVFSGFHHFQSDPANVPLKHEKIHTAKIVIPIAVGATFLYFGSEYFMQSLNAISARYGIDETMAGILITAPGTSMPELLVTLIAALHKRPGIALGNILGSNFINIVLVVGGAAIISPLIVSTHLLAIDVWVMMAATAIMCLQLIYFKNFSRLSGVFYLLLLATYFYALIIYR